MKKNDSKIPLCRVLNPQGLPDSSKGTRETAADAARRPVAIEGKTVYLVDVGFGGGYEFLEEVQAWFSRNMTNVKTVLRRKKGNMFVDDPGLWAEIKARGHAAILGVGG